MLFDLKVMNSVLSELEEERGIPREKILEAVEAALATAYKKEYGKKGQIVRCKFNAATGATEFTQVKIVVDESKVIVRKEGEEAPPREEGDERIYYNPEHHILIEDAKKIKNDAKLDDEITFPLEAKTDFGRIAAQTAKQVIIQKIREAEKVSVFSEYGKREGEIVSGTVQRIERGNIFVDMGRATGLIPFEEQIPGERFRQGERIRAFLYRVEDSPRGVFLRLSRSHPRFLEELFKLEAPEIASGVVQIKAIAREPGSRSKIGVISTDPHVDPVGSLVGQRGVRVGTVMSELGGEKIDIIEWSGDQAQFVEDALSPARVVSVKLDENAHTASVIVTEDQQSLAIGRGGQNVRLAAKLTGWRIDIQGAAGENAGAEVAPGRGVSEEVSGTDNVKEAEGEKKTTDVVEETAQTTNEETEKKEGGEDAPREETPPAEKE